MIIQSSYSQINRTTVFSIESIQNQCKRSPRITKTKHSQNVICMLLKNPTIRKFVFFLERVPQFFYFYFILALSLSHLAMLIYNIAQFCIFFKKLINYNVIHNKNNSQQKKKISSFLLQEIKEPTKKSPHEIFIFYDSRVHTVK